MSEIKTRADFVDAVAKMVRMCDEAGIKPTWKQQGFLWIYSGGGMPEISSVYSAVEFPLAILEGRPVFVGDEVYCNGLKYIAREFDSFEPCTYSWNPPKPKAVMVEMLREDAEEHASYRYFSASLIRMSEACRKALESSK